MLCKVAVAVEQVGILALVEQAAMIHPLRVVLVAAVVAAAAISPTVVAAGSEF
jgi:hypothetical protein